MIFIPKNIGVFLLQIFIICSIFCFFLLSGNNTFASSISYATVGEKFFAEIKDAPKKSDLSWTLTNNGDVLEVQKGKKFSTTFDETGTYIIRVLSEGVDKKQISTILTVLVDDSLPNFSPLEAKISSVPEERDSTIFLSGESESILFSFSDSTGKILKYEFEGDIFSDNDNDGEIDNDIENEKSPSYLAGGTFSKLYTNTGLPARARLRVFSEDGKMQESFVNIRFEEDKNAKINRKNKPLKAVLQTLPTSDDDGNIFISPEMNGIVVLGKYSEGNVVSYEIDTDISVDADGDGITDNDIENKNTDSFQTGEIFPIIKNENISIQTVQLTVRNTIGQIKKVKKNIIITDSQTQGSGSAVLYPVLLASRSEIIQGESVTFTVFNIAAGSKISWDFDGDGVPEIENGDEQKVTYRFTDNGSQRVKISILESGTESIDLFKTITVSYGGSGEEQTSAPISSFIPEVSDNSVYFSSSSSNADNRLANTDLSYSWDFGDGFKTQGPNPNHVYQNPGTYDVILTVEDSAERQVVSRQQIIIEDISAQFSEDQHGGKFSTPQTSPTPEPQPSKNPENFQENNPENNNENSSEKNIDSENKNSQNNSSGFRIPWWLLLILLIVSIPFIFLIKKKVDSPDTDFSVLIHDFLNRKKKNNSDEPSEDVEIMTGKIVEEVSTDQDEGESEPEEETPDWMRTYDDEENTEENKASDEKSEETKEGENAGEILQESTISEENNDSDKQILLEENSGIDSPFTDDLPDEESSLKAEETPFEIEHPEWLEEIKTPDEEILEETLEDDLSENHDDSFLESLEESEELGEIFVDDGVENEEENMPETEEFEEIQEREEVYETGEIEEKISEEENFLELDESIDGVSNIYEDGSIDNTDFEDIKREEEEEKFLASDAKVPDTSKHPSNIPSWMKGEEK